MAHRAQVAALSSDEGVCRISYDESASILKRDSFLPAVRMPVVREEIPATKSFLPWIPSVLTIIGVTFYGLWARMNSKVGGDLSKAALK